MNGCGWGLVSSLCVRPVLIWYSLNNSVRLQYGLASRFVFRLLLNVLEQLVAFKCVGTVVLFSICGPITEGMSPVLFSLCCLISRSLPNLVLWACLVFWGFCLAMVVISKMHKPVSVNPLFTRKSQFSLENGYREKSKDSNLHLYVQTTQIVRISISKILNFYSCLVCY